MFEIKAELQNDQGMILLVRRLYRHIIHNIDGLL